MALTEEFRKLAVEKFLNRGRNQSAQVAAEIGVSVTTLNKWVKRCGMSSGMPKTKKRPQERSPSEKFKTVLEFESLPEDKQGEFLRSNGLHAENIEEWKEAMKKSLESPRKGNDKNTPESIADKRKIKELEQQLNQKNKVIAETTALLVLKKKADLIWGGGEGE